MKKYEIINPSDKCFIHADDEMCAKVVCTLLGNGWYGLKDENGAAVMLLFEEAIPAEEVSDFVMKNAAQITTVLESFSYEEERTSLNDIGERARVLAAAFRKVGEEVTK